MILFNFLDFLAKPFVIKLFIVVMISLNNQNLKDYLIFEGFNNLFQITNFHHLSFESFNIK